MREGKKKMSLQTVVAGIPRTHEGPKRTKPFIGSSPHSLRVREGRLSAWYQGFHSHKGQKVRIKSELWMGRVSSTGKG